MYIASCAPSRNRSSPKFFGQNYYKFFLKYKNVYSFMCTEQKAQNIGEFLKSPQNFPFLVSTLFHVTNLTPEICEWL